MKKISNTEINKKILDLIIKNQDRYRLNSEEFEQFALRSEELLNNMKKLLASDILNNLIALNLVVISAMIVSLYVGFKYSPDFFENSILLCSIIFLGLILYSIRNIRIYRRITNNQFYDDELMRLVKTWGWVFIHNLEEDYSNSSLR